MKTLAHNSGTYIGKGGTEIFFQCWNPPSARGILIISHGVGEHSSRYSHIIDNLDGKNIAVYALDHRGHGKSGGKRGHVDSFMDYIYDLKLFIDYIKEDQENAPILLLGHSMGGVIATKYALSYPEDIVGLILSSPGLVPALKIPGWKKRLSSFMAKHFPRLLLTTGIEDADLSRDEDIIEEKENDLLCHDKVSAKWYVEYTNSGEECINRALEIRMPVLIFHGNGDKIVDYHGSETLFKNISSLDKELHIFDDMYHETMNDIGRETVIDIVSSWIIKHIKGKKKAPGNKQQTKKGTKNKSKKIQKKSAAKTTSGKKVKKTVSKPVKKTTKKAKRKK